MLNTQSHEAIVAKVKDIVAEVLKKTPDEVSEEVDFTAMGADSLDRMTLIIMLEDAMQCSISDVEAKTLHTVADAVSFIESKHKI